MKHADGSKPLTYTNAPRETTNGVEYLTDEASLALAKEIIEEDSELLESLAKQWTPHRCRRNCATG